VAVGEAAHDRVRRHLDFALLADCDDALAAHDDDAVFDRRARHRVHGAGLDHEHRRALAARRAAGGPVRRVPERPAPGSARRESLPPAAAGAAARRVPGPPASRRRGPGPARARAQRERMANGVSAWADSGATDSGRQTQGDRLRAADSERQTRDATRRPALGGRWGAHFYGTGRVGGQRFFGSRSYRLRQPLPCRRGTCGRPRVRTADRLPARGALAKLPRTPESPPRLPLPRSSGNPNSPQPPCLARLDFPLPPGKVRGT
jgi:hypothetical protein